MHRLIVLGLGVVLGLAAQSKPSSVKPETSSDEQYRVYTEHPRLFLRPQRLRLVRRERERQSIRWQQFETLMTGNAQMPEPGFSNALMFQVSGNAAFAKKAIDYALSPAADLRQTAIVYDWCQDALTEAQGAALIRKLQAALDRTKAAADIATMRSRALAAVALGDHVPAIPEAVLKKIVETWWTGNVSERLKAGDSAVFAREDAYPLFEMLHAIRDSLNIDLREQAGGFFKELPAVLLLSYYPAPYPAAENQYRIPMFPGAGEPDLKVAAMARVAELAIVAYDNNAIESQFLQGWLIQDRYILRSPFAAPYEFLWANPYQPGLSYYHMPQYAHDSRFGRLFLRSSWDEDAQWLGYANGRMQSFIDGKVKEWKLRPSADPLVIGDAAAVLTSSPENRELKFSVDDKSPPHYFIVGLRPNAVYQIEIDDEEMYEENTDRGGILALEFPKAVTRGIRIRPFDGAGTSR